ncbi:facilitated trehalose transporter Tret1-like isoform X2 [Bacillus rossius redtenbacheri]
MDGFKAGASTQVLVPPGDEPARRLPQYIATFAVTLGAFSLGNVLAWTSPTGSKLAQWDTNKDPSLLTPSEWAWVGSLVNIGAALSAVLVGLLIDRLGRRYTMLSFVLPFVAGWFMIAWAGQTVALYYVGRVITGMMGGAFSLTAPVYISEVAQKEVRGTLGACFQLMVVAGIMFVYVLGGIDGVSVFALTLTCSVVPLVFGVMFVFTPETPLFYVQKGRTDKARESLQWFRGREYNVDAELQEMETSLEVSRQKKLSWKEAFSTTAAKRALLISIGLMVLQQLSGVNAVIFYTSDIFKAAGSAMEPTVAAMIMGGIQVVATFASTQIVDRAGRRVLLLASGGVMGVCSVVLGVFFHVKDSASGIGWLPLASVCVFIALFSVGYGPIPWLMQGELFPPEIKGPASSISCMLNWLLSFFVTRFFSQLVAAVGQDVTFWIFGGITIAGTAFVFFVVPETKGKTLDEIQVELGGGRGGPENGDVPQRDKY